jgi:hypothetical protein
MIDTGTSSCLPVVGTVMAGIAMQPEQVSP